jgi:hypothetical protein
MAPLQTPTPSPPVPRKREQLPNAHTRHADDLLATEERWLHTGGNGLAMAIGFGSVVGALIGPEAAIGAALVGLASGVALSRRRPTR